MQHTAFCTECGKPLGGDPTFLPVIQKWIKDKVELKVFFNDDDDEETIVLTGYYTLGQQVILEYHPWEDERRVIPFSSICSITETADDN